MRNLVQELTNERKTLKQMKIGIKELNALRDSGYNVKQERVDGETYYWIKDIDDKDNSMVISPASHKVQEISWAEISDTHAGSSHHDKKGLDWFLGQAWAEGIRHVHHSGDLVDGQRVYPGQQNWLKFFRQEDQVNELCDTLSKHKFDYYAIDGNHDMSWNRIGAPKVGQMVADRIPNFHYVPGKTDRIVRGDLVIAGVMKRLVHPWSSSGRAAYALSYPSQTYLRNVFNRIKNFEIRDKKYELALLQYGHLHFDAQFNVYGVLVTHPLSFQHGNDYTEGLGLGTKTGGRLTRLTVQDGQILTYESKVLFVPDGVK